jgi:hypothetical protein
MTRDDLARAIVKLPGWRWMPGMRSLDKTMGPARVVLVRASGDHYVIKEQREVDGFRLAAEGWPDLTDAATGGCLLELLGDAVRHGHLCSDGWLIEYVNGGAGMPQADGSTLGAACARVALALGHWPDGGS